MGRVTAVYKPSQYPGTPDEATARKLTELFAFLQPGSADPVIDERHAGIAIAAHNPELALQLAKLSGFIAGKLPWCARSDLRELAIQTVNAHFSSEYAFTARIPNALAGGVGADMLAALPAWRTTDSFTEEQRLIVEYAHAVASGTVCDELLARLIRTFGEKQAVECTALVAFFGFWAMFLKATHA